MFPILSRAQWILVGPATGNIAYSVVAASVIALGAGLAIGSVVYATRNP